MKKTMTLLLLLALAFGLQSASPVANVEKKIIKKPPVLVNVYTTTGNPFNDLITVKVWNANGTYWFYVYPHMAAGTVLGTVPDECGYSVTMTSSGAPHNLGFYYGQASNVTTVTWNYGMCFTNCTTCSQIRIS